MTDLFGALTSRAQALLSRIRLRSAANPSLWLAGLSVPIFYLSHISNDPTLRLGFFIVGAAVVLNAVLTLQRLLWINPDYLRSEEHHIRKMIVERLGDDTTQPEMVSLLLHEPKIKAPLLLEDKQDE
jgi:hypothetical protein